MPNRNGSSNRDIYRYIIYKEWRRGRVDLSLKHGLVVWLIGKWLAILAVDDSRSGDSSLGRPIRAEEESLDGVAA
jgi:hypothetical protein